MKKGIFNDIVRQVSLKSLSFPRIDINLDKTYYVVSTHVGISVRSGVELKSLVGYFRNNDGRSVPIRTISLWDEPSRQ